MSADFFFCNISFDKALCIYFFSRDAYVDLRISIKTHAEISSH